MRVHKLKLDRERELVFNTRALMLIEDIIDGPVIDISEIQKAGDSAGGELVKKFMTLKILTACVFAGLKSSKEGTELEYKDIPDLIKPAKIMEVAIEVMNMIFEAYGLNSDEEEGKGAKAVKKKP